MCLLYIFSKQDGRRVLVIDVRAAADASSDLDATRVEVDTALQSALNDNDLGGHLVYKMPAAFIVYEPEGKLLSNMWLLFI